ncbi:MAG: helicase-associated domain-containing protein [Anaerolineaceae bacterium]|nr:helicase-associated domain-containing protein [Anaerolineaceae bacterium]
MPDLFHTLQGHDLGFLRIIAEAWGIELNAPDTYSALPRLTSAMLDADLAAQIVAALPDGAAAALHALLEHEGRLLWAAFSRRFGDVRTFGAARRDREHPQRNPISPAEVLWYRGLIGTAFLDFPSEPQEHAYIPEDLLELLGPLPSKEPAPLGRPASPGETRHALPVSDHILDDACTFLAARRTGRLYENEKAGFLQAVLTAAGLLHPDGGVYPEPTRQFLETPRGKALAGLVTAWQNSDMVNELLLTPGLVFEGDWRNAPRHTRQAIIGFITRLPKGVWWNITTFITAIREQHTDFQRPAGNYDSWFIRKRGSDAFLRGLSSWGEVEGALLRYFLTGPSVWLGITELACEEKDSAPLAFRLSPWADFLLAGKAPALLQERGTVEILPSHRLKLSTLTPRALRYQIARFCEWEKESGEFYFYRITPGSLEQAQQQGLLAAHLVKLLQRASARPLPPALLQAVERWGKFGSQVGLQPAVLLRVASPDILEALRKTKASHALLETLNPTTALLRPGSEETVRKALAELGYLSDSSLIIGKRV